MGKTKDYTDEQERIARYAKAMGHPARMAILQFLAGRETCFFGDIHQRLFSYLCTALMGFPNTVRIAHVVKIVLEEHHAPV